MSNTTINLANRQSQIRNNEYSLQTQVNSKSSQYVADAISTGIETVYDIGKTLYNGINQSNAIRANNDYNEKYYGQMQSIKAEVLNSDITNPEDAVNTYKERVKSEVVNPVIGNENESKIYKRFFENFINDKVNESLPSISDSVIANVGRKISTESAKLENTDITLATNGEFDKIDNAKYLQIGAPIGVDYNSVQLKSSSDDVKHFYWNEEFLSLDTTGNKEAEIEKFVSDKPELKKVYDEGGSEVLGSYLSDASARESSTAYYNKLWDSAFLSNYSVTKNADSATAYADSKSEEMQIAVLTGINYSNYLSAQQKPESSFTDGRFLVSQGQINPITGTELTKDEVDQVNKKLMSMYDDYYTTAKYNADTVFNSEIAPQIESGEVPITNEYLDSMLSGLPKDLRDSYKKPYLEIAEANEAEIAYENWYNNGKPFPIPSEVLGYVSSNKSGTKNVATNSSKQYQNFMSSEVEESLKELNQKVNDDAFNLLILKGTDISEYGTQFTSASQVHTDLVNYALKDYYEEGFGSFQEAYSCLRNHVIEDIMDSQDSESKTDEELRAEIDSKMSEILTKKNEEYQSTLTDEIVSGCSQLGTNPNDVMQECINGFDDYVLDLTKYGQVSEISSGGAVKYFDQLQKGISKGYIRQEVHADNSLTKEEKEELFKIIDSPDEMYKFLTGSASVSKSFEAVTKQMELSKSDSDIAMSAFIQYFNENLDNPDYMTNGLVDTMKIADSWAKSYIGTLADTAAKIAGKDTAGTIGTVYSDGRISNKFLRAVNNSSSKNLADEEYRKENMIIGAEESASRILEVSSVTTPLAQDNDEVAASMIFDELARQNGFDNFDAFIKFYNSDSVNASEKKALEYQFGVMERAFEIVWNARENVQTIENNWSRSLGNVSSYVGDTITTTGGATITVQHNSRGGDKLFIEQVDGNGNIEIGEWFNKYVQAPLHEVYSSVVKDTDSDRIKMMRGQMEASDFTSEVYVLCNSYNDTYKESFERSNELYGTNIQAMSLSETKDDVEQGKTGIWFIPEFRENLNLPNNLTLLVSPAYDNTFSDKYESATEKMSKLTSAITGWIKRTGTKVASEVSELNSAKRKLVDKSDNLLSKAWNAIF